MRIVPRALAFAIPFLLAGCKGTEHVAGAPSGTLEQRTVASMQPFITRSLTAQHAQETFGPPSSMTTAGEIVLVYNVEDEKKVLLGFPSLTDVITFARLSDRSGAMTDVPILP